MIQVPVGFILKKQLSNASFLNILFLLAQKITKKLVLIHILANVLF